MAKCKREACPPKAVGSDGKPLKGAAKNSFMAKFEREQGSGLSAPRYVRSRPLTGPVADIAETARMT
jgi:hypothetical protein